jgi:DNA-binding NarL/FixJ family response regulator
MSADLKVAIVEDQRPAREALALIIGGSPGYRTVGAWRTMEDALTHIGQDVPDVLLADINLPGMSGIEGVRQLKARLPSLEILMLTVYADNDHIFEAMCAGASGYLLKDTPPAKLLEALKEAQAGGAPMSAEVARKVVAMFQKRAPRTSEPHNLSARELEVLQTIVDGHTYSSAAEALHISVDTMRFHVRNIYDKLHVHSKSEAVLKALRAGIFR